MSDYGIFNDDGLIDGPYHSEKEAMEVAKAYDADEGAHVLRLCHDHPEHADLCCEVCHAEEE
jgi:hypothetical protein